MNKKLLGILALLLLFAGLVLFFKFSSPGVSFLQGWSGKSDLLLPILLISAAIDSVNPCAFSVLLLTIAFLFSLKKTRSNILRTGFWYIAGIFVVYLLIGLGILQALQFFNVSHFMAKVGAALLILWGVLSIVGDIFPSFPIRLKIPDSAHSTLAKLIEKASLPTALLLGALVGMFEFPCTGGPYLMILGLLHDGSTFAAGFGYLVLYNLIFVLPLILILGIASNRVILDRVQEWRRNNMRGFHFWAGTAIILLGVIILLS